MSIQRYVVSNDRDFYESWPDLVITKAGKLICLFCECTHHGDRSYSKIVYVESVDRGVTWSPKKDFVEAIHSDGSLYWDCPRITKLADNSLVVVCDKITKIDQTEGEIFIWKGDEEGTIWSMENNTGISGIVPDKLLETSTGRWIITAHLGKVDGFSNLQQRLWYSKDRGKNFTGPITVARDENLNLCEGSILEVEKGTLVCFLRENSSEGYECYATKSTDDGLSWGKLYTIPLSCCHRPVSGIIDTGEVLITYRYKQGAKKGWLGAWTQNTFLAITDRETVLTGDKTKQQVRIMPLNYDTSPQADLGYTGWVQFEDGTIYVVDYIKNQEEKAYIIGCSLTRADIGGI